MAVGTVKFFNSAKGFGFIAPESGEKDVFVHVSAVERAGLGTLSEGQRVSYEVVTERGKLAASNLKAAWSMARRRLTLACAREKAVHEAAFSFLNPREAPAPFPPAWTKVSGGFPRSR
jgi:CspA family cold shock protein